MAIGFSVGCGVEPRGYGTGIAIPRYRLLVGVHSVLSSTGIGIPALALPWIGMALALLQGMCCKALEQLVLGLAFALAIAQA